MNHLVIIRHYRHSDDIFCREIIKEGTISTVNKAFIAGLTQEVTFRTMFLIVALKLIFSVYHLVLGSRGSSVSIATGYGLDNREFQSQ
jgi:hypothetical protein